MTNFVTYSKKIAIIRNLKKSMMATKIQKTWRMHQIGKDAQIERLDARINKYENKRYTDEKKFGNYVKKTMKRVYFENKSIVKRIGDIGDIEDIEDIEDIYYEMTDMNDGKEKDREGFTVTMCNWFATLGKNEKFFDGYVKKYVDMPASTQWNSIIDNMIEMLENGKPVILWGNLGSTKTIYPLKKNIVKDFKKYWDIYQSKQQNIINMCIDDNDIMDGTNLKDMIYDMDQKIKRLIDIHHPIIV